MSMSDAQNSSGLNTKEQKELVKRNIFATKAMTDDLKSSYKRLNEAAKAMRCNDVVGCALKSDHGRWSTAPRICCSFNKKNSKNIDLG